MKILLHSHAFPPSIGGIETVSKVLAEELYALGHCVTVVTETPADKEEPCAYRLVRSPCFGKKMSMASESDVVLANGASLRMVLPCLLTRTPFIWVHQGYQTVCLEGLGWHEGSVAPLSPVSSIWFHLTQGRGLSFVLSQAPRMLARYVVARFLATNICVSDWVASRLSFPRTRVIPNPHPLKFFRRARENREVAFDFIFVGRLVSEKGVGLILEALSLLNTRSGNVYSLKIVGDGPERERLEELAKNLDLDTQVKFTGAATGEALLEELRSARVGLVPSIWEEPFGGVTVELMAAGLPVITSRCSGPSDKVGEAGEVVENGSVQQLADAMVRVTNRTEKHPVRVAAQLDRALEKLDEEWVVWRYESLLREVSGCEQKEFDSLDNCE